MKDKIGRNCDYLRTGQGTAARRNRLRPRKCKVCGKDFYPFHANDLRRGKLCSRACWRKYWKAEKLKIPCFHCKKEFITSAPVHRWKKLRRGDKRKFCSKRCFILNNKTKENPLCRQVGELKYHHDSKAWKDVSKDHRRTEPNCVPCGAKAVSTDHVIPFSAICRFAAGMNPDLSLNLMSLCRPCHGIKTGADRHLWRGDILRFVQMLRAGNWPMERLAAAGRHYGFAFDRVL